MKINQLKVKNFRNIKNIEYIPASGLNILVGRNAQGKTNLLEAIYMMSGQSSFRNNADKDLLNYDATNFSIRSKYNYGQRDIDLFLSFNLETGKVIHLNNKKVKRNAVDLLKVVLFTPDDLFLVKGSPAKRRYFLDFFLKQISEEYNYYLDNFTKVLKKRNFILKNAQTNTKSFKILNELFMDSAVNLILLRLKFVALFNEGAASIFKDINSNTEQLNFKYALSFPVNNDKINLEILNEELFRKLQEKAEEERRRKTTIVGPHLDDLHIYLDNRLAKFFASQGQQRNIVITMKLAEIYTFKKIKNYYPLFLLDEVLSELDNKKRQLLINELCQADYQSFLTSVNIDNLDLSKAKVGEIIEGYLMGKE